MSDINATNRRKFLLNSAGLAAAASLPVGVFAQESMRTRAIPGTDESLPVIGLGAPDVFINLPPEGKALPQSLIQAMVDLGGRVMDTPAFFRPDVPVVGELISEMGLRDELFLTGKITVRGQQEGIDHLEKTVANLGKRPIDLLMIHNMLELETHWPTLREWKDAGRVRYIGVSLTRQTTYSGLEQFMQTEKPDFILTGYSIFHPVAAERALPMAADLGIAVLIAEAFKAGDDGNFFGMVANRQLPEWVSEFDCESWAQFALKYILVNPAVNAIVTETSKVNHVVDNMGAGYGRLPDEATRERMRDYVLSL